MCWEKDHPSGSSSMDGSKPIPHHQDFKRQVVASWKIGRTFEIDSESIAAWLRKRGAEV